MPRETIASVKALLKSERTRLLSDLAKREASLKRHEEAIRGQNEHIRELIAGHAEVLAQKDARIRELLESNNSSQMQARASRADVVRLQGALSDASRVIHALGLRAEG